MVTATDLKSGKVCNYEGDIVVSTVSIGVL